MESAKKMLCIPKDCCILKLSICKITSQFTSIHWCHWWVGWVGYLGVQLKPYTIQGGKIMQPHYWLPSRIWKPDSISAIKRLTFRLKKSKAKLFQVSKIFNNCHHVYLLAVYMRDSFGCGELSRRVLFFSQ